MDRPGDYVPDATEGITRLEDLPPPQVERRSRNYRRRPCPRCGRSAPRCNEGQRTLHDLGNGRTGRPIDFVITYSKHRCLDCRRCFNADMSDLPLPKCHCCPVRPRCSTTGPPRSRPRPTGTRG